MSLPRYPEYKPSGVEWLGRVPGHWEKTALKFLAEYQNGFPFKPEDWGTEGLPIIRIAQLTGDGEPNYYAGTLDTRVKIESGDLLFSWSANIDAYIWEKGSAWLNQHIFKVTPSKEADKSFLYYVIKHVAPKLAEFDAHGSTMRHIKKESLGERVFVPTITEQTQIAAFLDRETAKIDELVAEQRRLMELLNEEIISLVLSSFRAPETSELRLSEVSTIISRPVIQKADESYTRIGLFNRGRGLFHKDASEMDEMGESDFFWVEEGDLIISGQFAWEGAVALADIEDTSCVVSHRYPVIRGKAGVALTEYLLGLLCTKHGDFLLNENSRGAAGRNRPLNISSLMKEKIPVPSMEIQKKVARAVHTRKALFKEIAKAIDLLQERRTALISAAVTGQIDVRQLTEEQTA